MSKIKALITTLVLGTSSVAMADTSLSFHAEGSWGLPQVSAPVVRDHRAPTIGYQQPAPAFARGTWISLAEPMTLRRGGATIDLSSRARLNQIRLQSASGSSFIGTVTVQFVGGASQVVTLNQWLDARNPMAQFNLNRTTQVDAIIINSARNYRGGKLQVFGYASSTRPTPPIYQNDLPPVYQPPVYQPQRTVALANSMTLAWTRGSKEITVDYNAGSFKALRITGVTGATLLSRVLVSFNNGHQQMIRVDRTLNGGESIDLALETAGRGSIARITVFDNDNTQVIGHAAGVFNVAAL